MGGGVLVLDYDRDGWPDIYFTNAPTVAMALKNQPARGALYHNNHDGTFTDVTDKAGVATPCFAMGGAVGDYNNDGWPDMVITCLGHEILYRNNGDGTFTDVTKQAGIDDPRWSTGAAFGDYDNDGFVDLMVTRYVDFQLTDLPQFGSSPTCKYRGIDVQCGPRGLRGAGDSLYHNNGDGTFTDVSKQAGVDDARGYYGLGVLWADFDNKGRPDIYVADDSTPKYLYRNDGNGKFTDIGLESGTAVSADGSEQGSMGIALGDYNHTGLPSLYVTNFADEYNILYREPGRLRFSRCFLRLGSGGGYAAVGEVGHGVRRSRQRRLARPDLGERPGLSAGGPTALWRALSPAQEPVHERAQRQLLRRPGAGRSGAADSARESRPGHRRFRQRRQRGCRHRRSRRRAHDPTQPGTARQALGELRTGRDQEQSPGARRASSSSSRAA